MTTPVGTDVALDFNVMDALNAGWITREDAALKAKLSGIRVPVSSEEETEDVDFDAPRTVTGGKTRLVPVYFRLPEDEVRKRTYPYLTIDFLTAVRDGEREHRGVGTYGVPNDDGTLNAYTPAGMPSGGGRGELPIPMQLQYQVTQWARWNRHDRIIMAELLANRLEPRFGFLEMLADELDDGSIRRLDLMAGPTNGDMRDEKGARVFRKMYTVGVSSELFHSDLVALQAVHSVDLTLLEI